MASQNGQGLRSRVRHWRVVTLNARGYDIEGVDYAEETIEQLKVLFPDLPVRVGEVTNLDVEDGHYSGYISLGVIEHCKEGPEPFLREACRVSKRLSQVQISP